MEMQPTAAYDYVGLPSANKNAGIQHSGSRNMQRWTTTESNFYTNLAPESTTSGQGGDGLIPQQNPQQVNNGELVQVKKSMRLIKACLIGMTVMLMILILAVTIFSLFLTNVIAITTSKETEDKSNLKAIIHNLTDNQKNHIKNLTKQSEDISELRAKIDILTDNQKNYVKNITKQSEYISNLLAKIDILTGDQNKIFRMCQNGGSFTMTEGLILVFLKALIR